MTSTVFTPYVTPVPSTWLNDINNHTYSNTPISPATTVHDSNVLKYTPAGIGAVATTVQSKLREAVSVSDFGASPAESAAVNTASVQAALNYANSLGGARVTVPAFTFSLNGSIDVYANTTIEGEGWEASRLVFTHAGDGLRSTWPINSSTSANINIKNLGIECSNVSNTGGGFVDVGGTFVNVENCYISGWKYGIIFDQTEVSVIHRNNLVGNTTAQVWLVNGAEHTVGAATGFTNRISVLNNQFNAIGTSDLLLDDGGSAHWISGNNFNGGRYQLRAAGVAALSFINNEMENASAIPINFGSTTGGAVYVGAVTGFSIEGNTIGTINTAGHDYNFYMSTAHSGTIKDNVFYYAQTSAIGSMELDISNINVHGNIVANKGAAKTPTPIVANSTSLAEWKNRCHWNQGATTYHVGAANSGVRTLTPASMVGIVPGARVILVNADGTSSENCLVTATTTTTFDCTLVSNKAANFLVFGTILPGSDEVGAVVLTLTGCTTSPAATCNYVKQGGTVTLSLGYMAGTSNTSAMTLTGLPARLFPSVARVDTANIANNGVWAMGAMQIDTSGVISFSATLNANFTTSFTASGGKGIFSKEFTYNL